ncbi:MAG: isocitrate lyase/phosphoenolpyruvate mutase family protein [Alphaproteobacteria bacterium]|nr:isocitrate lyase/phosphoenolpyruvate mutase family protein [Alphaproteobacteria bacterium]
MTQHQKARLFKGLHVKGDPLVLYNIWDAGGAKAIADAGAKAIATGSWPVAAAHGFEDGEVIPLDFVLSIVDRIAATVDAPLTVDFEGGYAAAPDEVAANVRRVIRAGAVGINFEDRVVKGEGFYSLADQVARIQAIRDAAIAEGVALFINARTDLFLSSDPSVHEELMGEAIERRQAYAEAGADGFFAPGLTSSRLIGEIVDGASLPVNILMTKDQVSLQEAAELGVSRASYGPGPYRDAMRDLAQRFTSLF